MKKRLLTLAALLLALMICLAAAADPEAAALYDETVDLLFHTDNVTLKVNAEFALNGNWFKTVEGTWMQDGTHSFRQLLLSSPRGDGTELSNGYTIVAEDELLYVMEVYNPGTYKLGASSARDSILRRSVETEHLIQLGRLLASQAELLLGRDILTETPEGEIRLALGEDAPAAANIALNQLARFAAKRYFGMDYDRVRADSEASVRSYTTPTEGILYTAQSFSLRNMDVTIRKDEDGRMQHVEGKISMYVENNADGRMPLDVVFTADVSDRGTTAVKRFSPEAYGVILEGKTDGWDDYSAAVDEEAVSALEARAAEIWTLTGGWISPTLSVSSYLRGDQYEINIEDINGLVRTVWISPDGTLHWIRTSRQNWLNESESRFDYSPQPDEQADRNARALMAAFLEAAAPDLVGSMAELKPEWIVESEGVTYAQYGTGGGVMFVVRLAPEMQIEYFVRQQVG